MTGVVWIAEDEDLGEDGTYLLGTFNGYHDSGAMPPEDFEGLSAEDAIAWGRARSDTVLIRLGRGRYYSAGTRRDPELEPWPPADLPPLVRRRPPEEAWKDRTPDDEPIAWRVDVTLAPPGVMSGGPLPVKGDPKREQWEAVVAEAARRAGADAWDDHALRGFIVDMQDAIEEAGEGAEEIGWTSYHSPTYAVRLTLEAPTAAQAEDAARARITLPDGWRVEVFAEPAD